MKQGSVFTLESSDMLCPLPLRRLAVATLICTLASCGGSSGPGVGTDDGGDPSGPPTVAINGFAGNPYVLPGDSFLLTFTANDAGTASVCVVLDLDGDPNTTGDQAVVFGPAPDAAGAELAQRLVVPSGLAPGRYSLLVIASDGSNPDVSESLATFITVIPAIAGVDPSQGSNRYAVVNDHVYFSRNETADDNQILNADGVPDGDSVLARYSAVDGMLVQGATSIDDASVNAGESQILPINASSAVGFETLEADENVDLDADGTQLDRVASFWRNNDAAPTRSSVTGLLTLLGFTDDFLQGHYDEAQQGGAGTNRNIAGFDADVLDQVDGYIHTNAGAPSGNGQITFWPFAATPAYGASASNLVYFPMPEADHAGLDVSGDGDALDTVLVIADFTAPGGGPGTFRTFAGQQNAPAQQARPMDATAGFDGISAPAERVAYYLDEANIPGDPNADGNGAGTVPTFYNVAGVEYLIPPPSPGQMTASPGEPTMLFQGASLWFCINEAGRAEGMPGTNNDGDTGLDLRILCWSDTSLGAAAFCVPLNPQGVPGVGNLIALSMDGGSVARLSSTWLGLDVQEAANGNQDINGNGTIDNALLLVDTTTLPPTLHNPQIRTTPAGNIPGTGIGSATGVLIRVLENLNGGDLDNDGNALETLFAFVRFETPTTVRVLDAGGDYAYIAGEFIGVTANEAFTNADYDGNSATTDFVFRVFGLDGGLRHGGTLSHPMSVPTSHTGSIWAFLRNEVAEARDLNGDSDQVDVILGVWSAP